MKKFILLYLLVVGIFTGCNTTVKENDAAKFLSYDQYKDFFKEVSLNLEIEGYEDKEYSNSTNLIFIDKHFSFGKREFLTLDGTQSNKETQEMIVFSNDEKNKFVILNLIYIDQELDKDLVYIKSRGVDIPSTVYKKSSEYIFSYYNILVHLTIINDSEDISFEESYQITDSILEYLNNFDNKVLDIN